jgi:hypothetical protein
MIRALSLFTIAYFTRQMITSRMIVYNTCCNLGLDEAWVHNISKEHSLLHTRVVGGGVRQTTCLKTKGLAFVVDAFSVGWGDN